LQGVSCLPCGGVASPTLGYLGADFDLRDAAISQNDINRILSVEFLMKDTSFRF